MSKRANELRKLTKEQREARLAELQAQLMKDRAQVAAGTAPKNVATIRNARKSIARIYTLRNE
jgi:large subunit ribosomal protein L29